MRLTSPVEVREALGAETLIHFDIDRGTRRQRGPGPSSKILLHPAGGTGTRCVARCSALSRARVGQQIEINVMTDRIHFFDPATTEAITS